MSTAPATSRPVLLELARVLLATVVFGAALGPAGLRAQGPDQRLPIPQGAEAVGTRLGGESIFGGEERLPTIDESGRLTLPPIATATTSTQRIGTGSVPKPVYDEVRQAPEPLYESVQQRNEQWNWSLYSFAAADTFSHPLYFEDVMLERHGHERFPLLQPMISGARFFATYPMLPYLMTVRHPCNIEYKVGHFRVGDPVYPYIQRPPYVRNAAIVQGAAVAGTALILP
jgi:hypothetical protein